MDSNAGIRPVHKKQFSSYGASESPDSFSTRSRISSAGSTNREQRSLTLTHRTQRTHTMSSHNRTKTIIDTSR